MLNEDEHLSQCFFLSPPPSVYVLVSSVVLTGMVLAVSGGGKEKGERERKTFFVLSLAKVKTLTFISLVYQHIAKL